MRTATMVAISVKSKRYDFLLFIFLHDCLTCNDSTYEGQEDVDPVLDTDALVVDLHGTVKSCRENISLKTKSFCFLSDIISPENTVNRPMAPTAKRPQTPPILR